MLIDNNTYYSPVEVPIRNILNILQKKLTFIPSHFNFDITLKGITTDSRRVQKDMLFVAIDGVNDNGQHYTQMALKNGAILVIGSSVLSEDEKELFEKQGSAYLKTESTREVTSLLAPMFYGYPAKELQIVAVTGTNGKTTTTTLLWNLFTQFGYKCGLIGTVENRIDTEVEEAVLTTPDAIALEKLFYRMKVAGCTHVFMEVSSHALAQHRTDGIPFVGAVFTNLSRDHLDYHGDMLTYKKTKKKLFDGLDSTAFALVNADDRTSAYMLQNCNAKPLHYGIKAPAEYRARIIEKDFDGTELLLNGKSVWVKLTGVFNVYNLLAVWGVANQLLPNVSEDELLVALSKLNHATGRFEVIRSACCTAIVDYAHTPDALIKVLEAIEQVAPSNSRIIAVIGAGGNRDKGKRPLMAKETYKRCHVLILTSDNPRNEDPQAIINDMLEGLSPNEQLNTLQIVSRKDAIHTALRLAKANDVVLVAGKGHETYQEINGVKHHFDDAEVITNYMNILTSAN